MISTTTREEYAGTPFDGLVASLEAKEGGFLEALAELLALLADSELETVAEALTSRDAVRAEALRVGLGEAL